MDKELEEKLNKIEKNIGEIRSDVEDIGEIRNDVGEIKSDVGDMKIDVGVNKTNILVNFKEAKEERAKIKTRIDETYNAVDGFIKIVTKLEDEFAAIKEDLKRVKDVIREKLGVDLF